MQPHKAAPSLFDLADPPAAAPSWASASSGVGTAPASRPSWAHVSGTFAPVDGVEGHEAEPLKRSEEHVLKSSVDFLRGRKHSGDWDLGVGPLSDASSDILSSEKEPSPDQIGSFMRYGDDDTRVQAMNRIVALLKAKVEARDATYLSHCVATVLRLAEASAFGRVRAAFREVLDTIKAAQLPGVVVPVLDTCTRWVSPHELPSIDASDANDSLVSRLLRSINVMEGRVPHIIMVLAWHPTFLERWYRSVMFLMRGPGPLPFLWRRFISIVACARFQCMPLLKLQEMDFLSSGGDPAWVREGLQCPDLPAKLHALMELNAMLAHQPWLITAQKMQALLGLSVSKEATWSIGELLHAISIMTMFHAMSGLVWGLGIRPELDLEQLHHTSLEGPQAHPFGTLSEDTIAPSEHVVADDASRLLDILKSGADSFTAQRQDWMESEADRKSYIWAEAEDTQSIHDLNNMIRASSDRKSADLQYCSKYIGPWTMTHEDFDMARHPIFYKAQYSWENDGYALVNQVLTGMAPLLDAELQHIRSLTYKKFAETNEIDTTAFREAIWHYSHRVKGMLDDDYNYAEVNQLLNRPIKSYIKKITCFPQTVTMADFHHLGFGLQPSEKVHVALLATEANKEAAMAYALRALTDWRKVE